MNGLPFVFGSVALLAAASARRGSRVRVPVGGSVWLFIKNWTDDTKEACGVSVHATERDAWEALIKVWGRFNVPVETYLEKRHYIENKLEEGKTQDRYLLGYWPLIEEKIVEGKPSIRDLAREER